MEQKHEHLQLTRWGERLPRRKKGPPHNPARDDKRGHGEHLLHDLETVSNSLQRLKQDAPVGVNPKLIFKVLQHPKGALSVEQLDRLGLRVLGIDSHKAMVVFPNQEALKDLQRRLNEYAGLVPQGNKYEFLSSVEGIAPLTPADRTGRILAANPLAADETAALDVELWHTGDSAECLRNVEEIRNFLANTSRRINDDNRPPQVTDSYVGSSLCLVRARLDEITLQNLISGNPFDYVKIVDRRPQPSFDFPQLRATRNDELPIVDVSLIPDDLVGVVVIDSDIMQGHPVLGPAVGDAQVFPDLLREKVQGGPEDGDEKSGGHGTAVAGIAAYGDIDSRRIRRNWVPDARVFSARVTNDRNEYDEDELLENQLRQAVEYYLSSYPEARVVNISLGNELAVYSDELYQFRLASLVDELAYEYRERNIVFVVAMGNYIPDFDSHDELVLAYPNYLLQDRSARIIDPATSAIALTVGGLSYGSGQSVHGDDLTDRLVAGHRGWPSPFTRAGWGFSGAVKPEIVEYAGDLRFTSGRIPEPPTYAGVPSTAKQFAPSEGQLFRTVSGTSFAAPRVSNLASRLMREFPNASSNLVRALIVDSARIPPSMPPALEGLDYSDDNLLRLYGYGQPDFERARWSADNEVLLLFDGSIRLDTFEIFEVPPLPEAFFSSKGTGYISASLAFDPPTRHTRADSYLGVTMKFDLFRNKEPDEIADVLRAWNTNEREILGEAEPSLTGLSTGSRFKNMKPNITRRSNGTVQRGILKVHGSAWKYDGKPLYLAVICQRRWASVEITDQRFAVVMSIYHDNPEANLYAQIRQQARAYQRTRVRL